MARLDAVGKAALFFTSPLPPLPCRFRASATEAIDVGARSARVGVGRARESDAVTAADILALVSALWSEYTRAASGGVFEDVGATLTTGVEPRV
jgi:hypothetical protein